MRLHSSLWDHQKRMAVFFIISIPWVQPKKIPWWLKIVSFYPESSTWGKNLFIYTSDRDDKYLLPVSHKNKIQLNQKCMNSFIEPNFARLRLRMVNWTDLWRKRKFWENLCFSSRNCISCWTTLALISLRFWTFFTLVNCPGCTYSTSLVTHFMFTVFACHELHDYTLTYPRPFHLRVSSRG